MSKHFCGRHKKAAFSWGLARISQPNLPSGNVYISSDYSGEDVNVYLLDRGIDYSHKDLRNNA